MVLEGYMIGKMGRKVKGMTLEKIRTCLVCGLGKWIT